MNVTAEAVDVKNALTVDETREIIRNELRRDLGEWMMANEDLISRPPVELTEEAGEFIAKFRVPGLRPGDVQIFVAPERLLIKGAQLLRSVEFTRPVDPKKVRAEIAGGILFVHAKIAEPSKVVLFRPRAA